MAKTNKVFTVDTQNSNDKISNVIKALRNTKEEVAADASINDALAAEAAHDENKATALLLRKVYGNIKKKEYTKKPKTSEALLAVYNGKEDITGLDATPLLEVITFNKTKLEVKEEKLGDVPVASIPYSEMTAQQLTSVFFSALGSETATSIVNMSTGNKIKMDMLDELKDLLRDSFGESKRPEILAQRLANALALTKEAHGSSLETENGNLLVYNYLNSKEVIECENFLFMADMNKEATPELDVIILDSAFKSYKAEVALGTLPAPDKSLVVATYKLIKGIATVSEDNKSKIANMTFD